MGEQGADGAGGGNGASGSAAPRDRQPLGRERFAAPESDATLNADRMIVSVKVPSEDGSKVIVGAVLACLPRGRRNRRSRCCIGKFSVAAPAKLPDAVSRCRSAREHWRLPVRRRRA